MSNSTAGQVHLIVKWIFCRQKYLEAGLKKLDQALKDEQAESDEVSYHMK
jgi:hypothetical protein